MIAVSTTKAAYTKPALSPPDLLAHLASRGLAVPHPLNALHALEYVGYFRLLVYMRPFQMEDPVSGVRRFIAGTTFEDVLALYDFDRELRLLCLDAVERIEVALRAAVASQVSVPAGPHFYLEPTHFDRIDAFVDFYQTARREDRHLTARHYRRRYHTPEHPPVWSMMEASTFGVLSRLFSGLAVGHRKAIALRFGFDEKVLSSWFRSISLVRNLCAHHGRLWNAPMHVDQPLAATRLRSEQTPTDHLYARLVALAALVGMVDPDSDWKRRLIRLLSRYPSVPLAPMGIPAGWDQRPFWR
nr:Abi family protein [Longimicrobium terrae]